MKERVKILDKKSDKLKWNFAMGLLHGMLFSGGMGFSDPNTVLPIFINSLTNSKVLIGLFAFTIGTRSSFSRLGNVYLNYWRNFFHIQERPVHLLEER